MSATRGIADAESTAVHLLVGTTRGLYRFASDVARTDWSRLGPVMAPCAVSHAVADRRDGSLLAAVNGSASWIYRSTDGGVTWAPTGEPLPCERVWHVAPGRPTEPGVVYAGVEPAALLRSSNLGATWDETTGLSGHPTRSQWWPGGGGLCLHTVVLPLDRPERIVVAVSVAGVFVSDDAGATWEPRNAGVPDMTEVWNAEHPDIPAQFGVHRCVHKVVCHPDDSDVLFQQNHEGAFRSADAGRTWTSINAGLPTGFGFPIGISAGSDPTIFVVPQDGETLRTRGGLAVWRSADRGDTWSAATDGLPGGELNVHREGMAVDGCHPAGVYVGTSTGGLYASTDGGVVWTTIAEDLGRICSVKAGPIG